MTDRYLAIIIGPRSLLRKLKNLASRITTRLSRELGDVFKLSSYGDLFDGIYNGLRRIIPLYLFKSGRDDYEIHYYYSIRHSSNFNYDLNSRLVMGDITFPISFKNMIYLSADISSLLELLIINMRRNNFRSNLVFIDQLIKEVSLRSKINSLREKIINIYESTNDPREKSAKIIKVFLSKDNAVAKSSFSIRLSEIKSEIELISASPLLSH